MSTRDHELEKTPRVQKLKRGFAAMSPEQRRAIASKGGRAVHNMGKANKFNSETAQLAGRRGGKAVSEDREHMAEIGRRGGEASAVAKGYDIITFNVYTNIVTEADQSL